MSQEHRCTHGSLQLVRMKIHSEGKNLPPQGSLFKNNYLVKCFPGGQSGRYTQAIATVVYQSQLMSENGIIHIVLVFQKIQQ